MTLVVAAVAMIGALLGVRMVDLTIVDARVARAQSVADATALAGVWGIDVARDAARRNGADIVDFEVRDGVVTTTVRIDGVVRAASAA